MLIYPLKALLLSYSIDRSIRHIAWEAVSNRKVMHLACKIMQLFDYGVVTRNVLRVIACFYEVNAVVWSVLKFEARSAVYLHYTAVRFDEADFLAF